jgi:hypothetical protein
VVEFAIVSLVAMMDPKFATAEVSAAMMPPVKCVNEPRTPPANVEVAMVSVAEKKGAAIAQPDEGLAIAIACALQEVAPG